MLEKCLQVTKFPLDGEAIEMNVDNEIRETSRKNKSKTKQNYVYIFVVGGGAYAV